MSSFQSSQIIHHTHLSRRQALLGLSLLALSACTRAKKQAPIGNGSYYTCSMHPFVHSQDPHGKCPVCGMDLQLVATTSSPTTSTEMAHISPQQLEEIGARTEVVQGQFVPSRAVLPTGNKFLVFVDHGEGQVEPREIKLGSVSGDNYAVISGLKAGERVFVTAVFLIDSESRIQGVLKTWGDR